MIDEKFIGWALGVQTATTEKHGNHNQESHGQRGGAGSGDAPVSKDESFMRQHKDKMTSDGWTDSSYTDKSGARNTFYTKFGIKNRAAQISMRDGIRVSMISDAGTFHYIKKTGDLGLAMKVANDYLSNPRFDPKAANTTVDLDYDVRK